MISPSQGHHKLNTVLGPLELYFKALTPKGVRTYAMPHVSLCLWGLPTQYHCSVTEEKQNTEVHGFPHGHTAKTTGELGSRV